MRISRCWILAAIAVLQVIIGYVGYTRVYNLRNSPGQARENATSALETEARSVTSEHDADVMTSPDSSNATRRRMIPKILHQVFSTIHVFQKYRPMIESCLRLNPDWKYYLWTEADASALIDRHYPQLKRTFGLMKMRLERSDATRYIVMHRFGGVYLDMDVGCKQPLLPTIAQYTAAFVGQEAQLQAQILWNHHFMAINGVLGSVPGHPFFKRLIDRLAELQHGFGNVMTSTGPQMLTRELKAYWNLGTGMNFRYPVSLTPSDMFLPLMDPGVNWVDKCRQVKVGVETNELERWNGCMNLKNNNWTIPTRINQSSIAVHYWLHLGYKPNSATEGRFNASAAFAGRVHFYSSMSRSKH